MVGLSKIPGEEIDFGAYLPSADFLFYYSEVVLFLA